MSMNRVTPENLHIGILILLVIIAPLAMTFTPYEGILEDGVWSAQFQLDPLNRLRIILISLGLVSACVSVALLFRELVKAANEVLQVSLAQNLVTKTSFTLCSLTIGWAAFPYWINGVFQAFSGNPHVLEQARLLDTILDFDPKALMPETWIGDFWRLGVLLIFMAVLCLAPILFVLNVVFCMKIKVWKQGLATSACLALSAAIFFLSPNYLGWLCD